MWTIDRVAWHVLDATADDWESLEQIEPHVLKFCEETDRKNIASKIIDLVSDGLFEEMPHEGLKQAAASPDEILHNPIEHWFRMTERGRLIWDAEGPKYRDEEP